MTWNATMPIWVCVVFIALPLALLALYFALLATNRQHRAESNTEGKQRTIDALVIERDEAQKQCKIAQDQREKLNRENDALHTHVTIMEKSLNAAQAEVERLNKPDLTTLPLQEAVKPVLRRQPRSGPKKEAL